MVDFLLIGAIAFGLMLALVPPLGGGPRGLLVLACLAAACAGCVPVEPHDASVEPYPMTGELRRVDGSLVIPPHWTNAPAIGGDA